MKKTVVTISMLLALFAYVGPVTAHSMGGHSDRDHDGIEDTSDDHLGDHDNDGVLDTQEADDDGDAIPDCIEKGKFKLDSDNDGQRDKNDDSVSSEELDTTDTDQDGYPDVVERGRFRKNHDNTGRKDKRDLDDDNDGILDSTEDSELRFDHDNDGVKDVADTDDDDDGVEDTLEAACHGNQDHDNDGIRDRKDEVDDGADDSMDSELAEVEVEIEDSAFNPAEITVLAGGVLKIKNRDSMAHTFTDVHGSFNTGTILPGETAELTLSEVGTYHVYCAFHPEMTATVTVSATE